MKHLARLLIYVAVTAFEGLLISGVQAYITLQWYYPFQWLVDVQHLDEHGRVERLAFGAGILIINLIAAFVLSGGLEELAHRRRLGYTPTPATSDEDQLPQPEYEQSKNSFGRPIQPRRGGRG